MKWRRGGYGWISDDGSVYIERGAGLCWQIWFRLAEGEYIEDEFGAYHKDYALGMVPVRRLSEIDPEARSEDGWFGHFNDGYRFADAKATAEEVWAERQNKQAAADYHGGSQPFEDGDPLHAMTQNGICPSDVYEHPEYLVFGDWGRESIRIMRAVRGKPEAMVTIYRGAPPGTESINTGDWVTLEKDYAQLHIDSNLQGDGSVLSAQVPARWVRFGGSDLIEWGYWGPPMSRGSHTAATLKPLRMGPGIFYRLHPKDRPFSRADASTAPLFAPEGIETSVGQEFTDRWIKPRPGYSAFANPLHLQQYIEAMNLDPSMGKVICFSGRAIEQGGDGEPVVIPDSDTPIETIASWEKFCDRVEATEEAWGYGRWDEDGIFQGSKTGVDSSHGDDRGRPPGHRGDDRGGRGHGSGADGGRSHDARRGVSRSGRLSGVRVAVRYQAKVRPEARADYAKVDPADRPPIRDAVRSLRENPDPPNAIALKGYPGFRRLRVGVYRIVFERTQSGTKVWLVAHRKDVYERLKRLKLGIRIASWDDVRAKATRIRGEGGVRIISANEPYLVAEVKGDSNIYQTQLMMEPGSKRVAMWDCGCPWSAYSWGRSGRWKKYEGRMCAHALALAYEAQSQGMLGGEVREDEATPEWREDPTVMVQQPGDYKKPMGHEPWKVAGFDGEGEDRICVDCGHYQEGEMAIPTRCSCTADGCVCQDRQWAVGVLTKQGWEAEVLHSTTLPNAEAIMQHGFRMMEPVNGRLLGDGVYFSLDADAAYTWEDSVTGDPGALLRVHVALAKPLIFDSPEQFHAFRRNEELQGGSWDEGGEKLHAWARARGYDGIVAYDVTGELGGSQVVVFNPASAHAIGIEHWKWWGEGAPGPIQVASEWEDGVMKRGDAQGPGRVLRDQWREDERWKALGPEQQSEEQRQQQIVAYQYAIETARETLSDPAWEAAWPSAQVKLEELETKLAEIEAMTGLEYWESKGVPIPKRKRARMERSFRCKVHGQDHVAVDVVDSGVVLSSGATVDYSDVVYPRWDPSLGIAEVGFTGKLTFQMPSGEERTKSDILRQLRREAPPGTQWTDLHCLGCDGRLRGYYPKNTARDWIKGHEEGSPGWQDPNVGGAPCGPKLCPGCAPDDYPFAHARVPHDETYPWLPNVMGKAASAVPVIRMYHGTNEAAVERIHQEGLIHRTMEDIVHEVADNTGIPYDKLWAADWSTFTRSRSGEEPHVNLTFNLDGAQDYARMGSESLGYTLAAAEMILFGKRNPEWNAEYRQKHGVKPMVLMLDIPLDWLVAHSILGEWKNPTYAEGPEDFYKRFLVSREKGYNDNIRIMDTIPASFIVGTERTSLRVVVAKTSGYADSDDATLGLPCVCGHRGWEHSHGHCAFCYTGPNDFGAPEGCPDFRPVRLTTEAAANDSNGVMIALCPPVSVARALDRAVEEAGLDDREPVEMYHMTLAYLGKVYEQEQTEKSLVELIQDWAMQHRGFFHAQITGWGQWTNSEGENVLWAAPSIVGIDAWRADLVMNLKAADWNVSEDYGFAPHLTVAYTADAFETFPEMPDLEPFVVDHVIVAWGGTWNMVPLMDLDDSGLYAAAALGSEPTDDVLDAVADALTDEPLPPSVIARKAKVTTYQAFSALEWLLQAQMCVAIGNGAWRRYRNRRFGEVPSPRTGLQAAAIGVRPSQLRFGDRRPHDGSTVVDLRYAQGGVEITWELPDGTRSLSLQRGNKMIEVERVEKEAQAQASPSLYRGLDVIVEEGNDPTNPQTLLEACLRGRALVSGGQYEGTGMHWTTDRDVAERFALHMGKGPHPVPGKLKGPGGVEMEDEWYKGPRGTSVPVLLEIQAEAHNDQWGRGTVLIPSEKEVTLAPGTPVQLRALSWFDGSQWIESSLGLSTVATPDEKRDWDWTPEERDAWEEETNHRATLNEEPESALPTTDGEESMDADPFAFEGPVREPVDDFREELLRGVSANLSASTQINLREATNRFLAREAGKVFSPDEQAEIIDEGRDVTAGNLDRLSLDGTHYLGQDDEGAFLW